jgi:hypothetical protein
VRPIFSNETGVTVAYNFTFSPMKTAFLADTPDKVYKKKQQNFSTIFYCKQQYFPNEKDAQKPCGRNRFIVWF